ncbi:MAG: hypothetical protein VB018_03625 [Lachnospiraceae bacterium]|nr:hypothetical protein [Lachnospiraceae bacterium]
MGKKTAEIRVKECFENSDYKKRNNNVVKIVAKLIANIENI